LTTIHGFVRSPEGTITLFDPPFCVAGETSPQSINDKGVITGSCDELQPSRILGWVRGAEGFLGLTRTTQGRPMPDNPGGQFEQSGRRNASKLLV
jgi:hypothetical protein